jgi:DNA-binding SARP family transcriptional activator
MVSLFLSFLGSFEVRLRGQLATFATDRTRALLAYLAVEANRPHRREALATLLWPNQTEEAALRNLTQTLVRLRQAIDDYHATPPFLQITAKTVAFKAETAELDVVRFQTLRAACATHSHSSLAVCPVCVKRLEQAAHLYRGEFLQGLFLTGSEPFEEWALFKREQLYRQALDVLHQLTVHTPRRNVMPNASWP